MFNRAVTQNYLQARTLSKKLQELGFGIGRDKTRRLMKAMGLVVKNKHKYKITTDSAHSLPIAENILSRQFNPDKPNQAWGTVWTGQGWLYLAVVIDLYSRRVVGWCIDKRMKKSLVIRALMMAINDIREYVAVYYNAKRLHSTLGYMTPLEFEKTA